MHREDTPMQTRRIFLGSLASTATLASVVGGAQAQLYPSRAIKMIVPFPPGGPVDAIGRVIAEGMRASLGQPVIVENVGGASGSLGTGQVARATPDGYTVGLGNSVTHVINGAVYPLNYDVLTDFEPVSLLTTNAALIVAKKAMPANNLRELIVWLKANPGKALAGTSGVGSASHEAGLYFENMTGTRFQFVPYRGLGLAIQDLVSGQLDIMISFPANALPQVRAGTIKAYAVTSKTRLASAPEIPTVDEAGLPGFYYSSWHALFVPKDTPKGIVRSLDAAVMAALADPAVRVRLINLGQDIFSPEQQTPEALATFQKADIEKRWPIIKAAGIKAE
jgi:tripartite-type tricarboxylate transporter receptor subunit TctC